MEQVAKSNILEKMELVGFGISYRDTISEMLENTAMFRTLARKDIEILSDYFQAYRATAGLTVLEEGKMDQILCLLVKGKLGVYKADSAMKRKHLATILPGRTIGEMSFIDRQPHSASVKTVQDSLLLVLTKNKLDLLSERHPITAFNVVWKIAHLLSSRLRQTSGKLVSYL